MNKETVGVYIGRFQPITKGHLNIINKMANNNKKSFIIVVRGIKTQEDKERNPYSQKEQEEMFNLLELPNNVNVLFHTTAYFFPLLEGNYLYNLYCGEDREIAYKNSFKSKINKYIVMARDNRSVSASKVRVIIKHKQISEYNTSLFEYVPVSIGEYLKEKHNMN